MNITLKTVLIVAFLVSMAPAMYGMKQEKDFSEDVAIPRESVQVLKKIVDIICYKDLSTEEKIQRISENLFSRVEDHMAYEWSLERPLLFYAIRAENLELVKFLVEKCKVNINAQYMIYNPPPVGRLISDLSRHYFDCDGKAVVYGGTVKKSVLEYAADHSERIEIFKYLAHLPGMEVTDQVAHNILSFGSFCFPAMVNKKGGYHWLLNTDLLDQLKDCLDSVCGTSAHWLGGAYTLVTSGLTDINDKALVLLDGAMARKGDGKLDATLIEKLMHAINAHKLLTMKEKVELIKHNIFEHCKLTMKLTKENFELAVNGANSNDFSIAKILIHHKDLKSQQSKFKKELLLLANRAIELENGNCVMDIVNQGAWHEKDLSALYGKSVRNNNSALAQYIWNHTIPFKINAIFDNSTLPRLKGPITENEQRLLETVKKQAKMIRFNDLEKLLNNHGGQVVRMMADPVDCAVYGHACNILLAQLWNLSPSGPHQDKSSSKNGDTIGSDVARHIMQYMGARWFK